MWDCQDVISLIIWYPTPTTVTVVIKSDSVYVVRTTIEVSVYLKDTCVMYTNIYISRVYLLSATSQ